MKCKFPEKNCPDRFLKGGCVLMCRLPEWKRKIKVCPYDKNILSKSLKLKKGQTELK